jgi:hypothetical protein
VATAVATHDDAGHPHAPPPAPPARRRRQAVRAAALGGLFVVLAFAMAFPRPGLLTSHVAGNLGDAMFSQWLLRWNAHALLTDPFSLFDPNIYWPTKVTLVYSDTTLAAVPVSAALSAVVGWPLTYNLIYIGTWMASLASGYLLARWFTGHTAASVLAAVVFSFAAVRLSHYGHFPQLFAFLAPLSLWLLLRFLTERDRPRTWIVLSVALGVALAACLLNAGYVALVLGPAVAVVAGGWLVAERFRPGPRFWSGLALAAAVTLLLTWPVLYKFRSQGDLLQRGYVNEVAAHPGDFLAPGVGSYLYGFLEDWADRDHEHRLFPGALALVLGGVGLVAFVRRRAIVGNDAIPAPAPHHRRRALWLLLAAGAVTLVMSLGQWQTVAGQRIHLPYRVLAELGPGFGSVRAFGRFTVVPLAVLAVLVAIGFAHLARRPSPPRRAWAVPAAATVIGGLMLVEYAVPIQLEPRFDRPEHAAVNHALADLPEGPVLELPMGSARDHIWGYVEPPRMLLSAIDWYPRVNGYSGYTAPGYVESVDLFNAIGADGPIRPEALARLDQLGVRYIVVRTAPIAPHMDLPGVSYYSEAQAEAVVEALPAERVEGVTRHGAAVLVRLREPPPQPPATSRP